MYLRSRRSAALLFGFLFALVPLTAACGLFGDSDTKCGVDGACTVSLDRTEKGSKAEVLGMDIKLVKVEGDMVTLEVGGQEIVVPKGESEESGDNAIKVDKITEDEVVLKVTVI